MKIKNETVEYYKDLLKRVHTISGFTDTELNDLVEYHRELANMTKCLPVEYSFFKRHINMDLEMLERMQSERKIRS